MQCDINNINNVFLDFSLSLCVFSRFQGIDMIPYQEAITQNLLSDFVLTSENLTQSEWVQLTTDMRKKNGLHCDRGRW